MSVPGDESAHGGARRKLVRVGLLVLVFVVTNVASALIGAATLPSVRFLWNSVTVAKSTDEQYCTFGNESEVRDRQSSFRIKTVSESSYFPSVCTNKQSAKRGDIIIYGLRVTNNGTGDVPPFLITNHLANGVSYIQGSSTAAIEGSQPVVLADNWMNDGVNLGGLRKGESRVIFFRVKVNNDVLDGQTLENTGQFQRLDHTGWIQCAVTTRVSVPLG